MLILICVRSLRNKLKSVWFGRIPCHISGHNNVPYMPTQGVVGCYCLLFVVVIQFTEFFRRETKTFIFRTEGGNSLSNENQSQQVQFLSQELITSHLKLAYLWLALNLLPCFSWPATNMTTSMPHCSYSDL